MQSPKACGCCGAGSGGGAAIASGGAGGGSREESVYEISQALKEQKVPLSPTAVREVLKAEGFAALPRRLDDERPQRPQPTVEPIADARAFSLAPRKFFTRCGGLFLFLPELVRLEPEQLAHVQFGDEHGFVAL